VILFAFCWFLQTCSNRFRSLVPQRFRSDFRLDLKVRIRTWLGPASSDPNLARTRKFGSELCSGLKVRIRTFGAGPKFRIRTLFQPETSDPNFPVAQMFEPTAVLCGAADGSWALLVPLRAAQNVLRRSKFGSEHWAGPTARIRTVSPFFSHFLAWSPIGRGSFRICCASGARDPDFARN
jgi:hypothetical protein